MGREDDRQYHLVVLSQSRQRVVVEVLVLVSVDARCNQRHGRVLDVIARIKRMAVVSRHTERT